MADIDHDPSDHHGMIFYIIVAIAFFLFEGISFSTEAFGTERAIISLKTFRNIPCLSSKTCMYVCVYVSM